ncbi:MAG: energy-coupled thiamine transporter ThiT, partial [Oscillospiraceae bacterium]
MDKKTSTNTKTLAQCAMLLALAVILSKVEIPIWLHGGSITLASMVPIVFISYLHGTKWGVGTAMLYSLIQMFMGFANVLYCK